MELCAILIVHALKGHDTFIKIKLLYILTVFYFKDIQIETFPQYISVESLNQILSSSHANSWNQKKRIVINRKDTMTNPLIEPSYLGEFHI